MRVNYQLVLCHTIDYIFRHNFTLDKSGILAYNMQSLLIVIDLMNMALTESQKRRIEEEERHRAQIAATVGAMRGEQKYGVPALLSFIFPGLGQVIKGQVGKGVLIMIAQFVFFLLSFVVIGVIPLIILWIWAITDAYNHKPVKEVQV